MFKAAFIAHAPNGDLQQNRCTLQTSTYKLFVRLVRDQHQAVKACKELVNQEGIHSILLCPGFTHSDIAEISEEVGGETGVFVARGDGPSSRVTKEVMEKEGFFSQGE